MFRRQYTISLDLGLNERYDHRVAIGILKFARSRPDWRLTGKDWLFRPAPGRRSERPDGIIARITSRDDLTRLLAHRVPIVDIANSYEDVSLPIACNDDFLTGHLAGEHFLSKGFDRFAYVGIDGAVWSSKRREGLWAAVREAAEGALPEHLLNADWLRRDAGLKGLSRWLAKLPRPCAVLAVNDLVGYRVSMAAGLAGIRVPEEMAIMGVDNEEVYCELSEPRLTSIVCDCERIGMEAAEMLSQLLAGGDPLRRAVIPPLGIEARESTDVVIGKDELVRAIKAFMRANIGKGVNVADVASAFPLSRRSLEKRFLQAEGRTLHDELVAVRMERAKALLTSGRGIHAACFESGFTSLQHFYRTFKRQSGVTPARYAGMNDGG